jgi:hypothetical protein
VTSSSDKDTVTEVPHREAGEFADRRFRARRRLWRRRVWWVFPLVALLVFGTATLIGFVFARSAVEFYAGFGCGAALMLVLAFIDAPPHHVERWRQGAEGERRTARSLRGLSKADWQVIHDVDVGRGNIDHVLVGPAGVFVLETKQLNGDASVRRGVLSVHWREDPDDGYRLPRLTGTLKQRSSLVAQHLEAGGLGRLRVQPIVVLWAGFAQGSVVSGGVAWVQGELLAEVLGRQPRALTPEQMQRASAALLTLGKRESVAQAA